MCLEATAGHGDTMPGDLFLVCWPKTWVADELAAAAGRRGMTVTHSYGMDLPAFDPARLGGLWTSGAHGARLMRAGWQLPLTAPGPRWLAELPSAWTQRRIWAGQLRNLDRCPFRSGFAKAAEAKVPQLPGTWYDDLDVFARHASSCGMEAGSWVQVADRRLELELEVRCFVGGQQVTAAAPYLWERTTDLSPVVRAQLNGPVADAVGFAGSLLGEVDGPPGFVVDVARTTDGTWMVVEANPAWCSGFYDADVDGVMASLTAAFSGSKCWAWQPDAVLQAAARRRPLLRANRRRRAAG